ncbi:MAG: hypothetical protein KGL93_03095 [Gemmatimonadota bacterium]|nr:hypothetical protein [Gemmatimonadota bacterium]
MRSQLSFTAVGHASSVLLATSFVLCVAFGVLFPGAAMFRAWQPLLPGFQWLSWWSFLLGLAESYAYGWYVAALWVPAYNFAMRRTARQE